MWPQHERSDRHMVDRSIMKLNRRQGRRFCSIIHPIAADSHIVCVCLSVELARSTKLAGRQG